MLVRLRWLCAEWRPEGKVFAEVATAYAACVPPPHHHHRDKIRDVADRRERQSQTENDFGPPIVGTRKLLQEGYEDKCTDSKSEVEERPDVGTSGSRIPHVCEGLSATVATAAVSGHGDSPRKT